MSISIAPGNHHYQSCHYVRNCLFKKKISVMSACIISFAASLAGVLKILDNGVDNDEKAVGFSRDDCQSDYGS